MNKDKSDSGGADDRHRVPEDGRHESSSVMRELLSQAMDDGYSLAAAARAPEEPGPGKRWFGGTVVVLVALGLLLTVAAIQTRKSAPAVAEEKSQLVVQISDETSHIDRLRARATALEQDVDKAQNELLTGTDVGRSLREQLDVLSVMAGTSQVSGPGMKIVLNDAPTVDVGASDDKGRILDIDLQQTVNGLWSAGAEAIAINGLRLTSLTAIRGASEAITVDYRPLSRPYIVEAIGNPDTLQSRFNESPGGEWLSNVKADHHIPLEISTVDKLTLPADPAVRIRFVTTEGSQ